MYPYNCLELDGQPDPLVCLKRSGVHPRKESPGGHLRAPGQMKLEGVDKSVLFGLHVVCVNLKIVAGYPDELDFDSITSELQPLRSVLATLRANDLVEFLEILQELPSLESFPNLLPLGHLQQPNHDSPADAQN